MGDALTLADLERAMRMLVEQPAFVGPLRYFATPAEMANPRWREWFARNHPCVELVEVKPCAT